MSETSAARTPVAVIGFAWLAVGLPLLWGVYQTFLKAIQLFQ